MPDKIITDFDITVAESLAAAPVTDIHTHLFDPGMGRLLLWGIDELVTYHYLVAELFRARPDKAYEAFWKMPKTAQADLIWKELFVKRSPLSEACRGVLTVMSALGMDPNAGDLRGIRKAMAGMKAAEYVDRVFQAARVERVYMTNDPLDPAERAAWRRGFERDPRFQAVLRLDSAFMPWPEAGARLAALGYRVDTSLSGKTLSEVRRYLKDWIRRMRARYMAISLPPSFAYPEPESPLTNLMAKAAAPVAAELGIPLAMMIGVKKLVNPGLVLAGDSVGKAEIETVEALARDFPKTRFLVTMLSRENTHELCVAARKFGNILPFGCWWFLNTPVSIREITAMRLELLGPTFIPQHSDARVLDQLIYKWKHSRALIGPILAAKYRDAAAAGRRFTVRELKRDLSLLFGDRLLKM